MGKGRGRPPWRRGDPGDSPDAELREMEHANPLDLPHHDPDEEEPDLEDLAAVENTEEEQDQMARGEWDLDTSVEELAEAADHRVIEHLELESIGFSDQPSVFPGADVQIVTREAPEFSAPDPAPLPCADTLKYEDTWYACTKLKHSPLVGHNYEPVDAAAADILERASQDTVEHVSITLPNREAVDEFLVEQGVQPINQQEWETAIAEPAPDTITVDITPDLPVTEPGPIPPTPDEVETQKQKGIDQLEEKLETDTSEFKRWKRQELKGYLELVKQGYDPDASVHFRRLTPAQLAEVKRAS